MSGLLNGFRSLTSSKQTQLFASGIKRKEKKRPWMKGLAQSPLFLTQPVRGGEGGRAQERNREIGHSRLHPCKKSQGEQYTFRSGGPTILHFSHREDRFLHRRKERQKSWPLCRKDLDLYGLLAVLDKGLRCSAPNPPEKQRILIHRLI